VVSPSGASFAFPTLENHADMQIKPPPAKVHAQQPSPRVAALLAKLRHSNRGRLIFACDATASRQPTWDLACSIQTEMFAEVAKIGGLEVQLVWYRGYDECKSLAWTLDADELARAMRRTTCEAGYTKIGKVLAHVRNEHARAAVNAVIFIGDTVEETPQQLYDAAAGLGVPLFMFQEGDELAWPPDRFGMPTHIVSGPPLQKVEIIFRELARLSGGAYGKFNAGAAAQLAELLRAVAAFAVGGLTALANQNSESARKLLGQMK
jgi:hypothetical protein